MWPEHARNSYPLLIVSDPLRQGVPVLVDPEAEMNKVRSFPGLRLFIPGFATTGPQPSSLYIVTAA